MSALVHEEEGFSNKAEGGSIAPSLIKSRLRVLIRSKIVYDADFDGYINTQSSTQNNNITCMIRFAKLSQSSVLKIIPRRVSNLPRL